MERINVTQAARRFSDLLNRVLYQGATFELERGNKVIARITPAGPPRHVPVRDLNGLFSDLPELGDDAATWDKEQQELRNDLPRETDPWD